MAPLAQKHIREVRVVNYLSHVDTRVTFTDGINIIRGANGSGKTALVNAISATLLGLSIPKEDIRHGQKSMSIEVTLADGTRIKRSRTASTQSYTFYDPGTQEETTYNGVSDDTKELLAKLTGMGQQRLSQREAPVSLNFEPIGADAFLVEGASPAVLLNRISSLQPGPDFSAARKSLITDAGRCKRELAAIQDTAKQVQAEQDGFQSPAWDKYLAQVVVAQEALSNYKEQQYQLETLETLIDDTSAWTYDWHTQVELPRKHLNALVQAAERVKSLQATIDICEAVTASVGQYQSAIKARNVAKQEFDAIGTLTPCAKCNRLVLGGNSCPASS